jgi:hypothetical protein
LRILVLGSASGSGFANGIAAAHMLGENGDPRVKARSRSSLAMSPDGGRCFS